MPELIKDTKVTHYVDHYHMQQYLSEKLGKPVEIIESPNDTDYHLSLKKIEPDPFYKEDIKDFLETGYIDMGYKYHIIFDYCVNQGWLEEGDYILRVSW